MFVYNFQMQVRNTELSAQRIVQGIDARAPVPQALEGGNGKGPLYDCVLDVNKMDQLESFLKDTKAGVVYSALRRMELLEQYYRPDFYVNWQFGKDPIVSGEPF